MNVPFILLGAVVAAIVLMQLNRVLGSPVVAIADRWLRCAVFSLGGAQIIRDLEWSDKPMWTLSAACFLVWFLGETVYNWLAIAALSASPLPLFPRYIPNGSGDEWPIHPRLLRIREWLRANGFRPGQALKAEVGGGIYLRVSVHQDGPATTRVHVTFLPAGAGGVTVCASIVSLGRDGSRYVTDNLHIPFAGFYPENWWVERRPCTRSLARLMERHRRRVAAAGIELEPFAVEPLADLNATQHELDRLNTQMGFLHAHGEREDLGKITQEGRYRVWKEIWTLKYLGRPARYF